MSYYREGDYYLIDDRTGFKLRRSDVEVQWDGRVVEKGDCDERPPTRLSLRPERPLRQISPAPEPTFITLPYAAFQIDAFQPAGFQV